MGPFTILKTKWAFTLKLTLTEKMK